MKSDKLKKTIGFIALSITFMCWIIAPLIPFTNIPNKAIITTIVVISGELIFVLAIYLLGKEYWGKIKLWFKKVFSIKRYKC